jgi:preprotein translocase subunit SecE
MVRDACHIRQGGQGGGVYQFRSDHQLAIPGVCIDCKESYNELVHKTSWPTRKELAQSSVIVLIASIILALIVWLMDWCFESIMTFVYGLF